MTNNEIQYTIYIRSTKESIPVSKEEFDAYYHDINIYRIRQQRHGRCVCPASKRLTCDMDCLTCPFHRMAICVPSITPKPMTKETKLPGSM